MVPSFDNGFIVRTRSPAPRGRLFCFPYAGGGSSIYSRWQSGLPEDIEVCAVELPGRGRRAFEPCLTDMPRLVDQLCSALSPMLDAPFFFFGHSMGAILAFSCARALRERALRMPDHLIVSARASPEHPNPDQGVATLSDPELIALLRRRGGTPPEVLAEPDLVARLLPSIRADFALLESYRFVAEPPLECPITAFGGAGDSLAPALGLSGWAAHTTRSFSVEEFDGGHFFINTAREAVLRRVRRVVRGSPAA